MLRRGSGRLLTEGERGLARSIFGAAIDLDRVRLHHRAWWPFQPRNTVMAPDGHIWFHPKGDAYRACFADMALHLRALLVHELVHVWQHQRGLILPLRRHPFCRYDYAVRVGWRLDRYGIEQQAEIVEHVFLLRHGATVPGAPALAVLESILPFA